MTFTDDKTMTFIEAPKAGEVKKDADSETVKYTAVEIRPNVYMVYWHENGSKDNVVHIQDFENGIAYTNIAGADSSFYNLKGTIKFID